MITIILYKQSLVIKYYFSILIIIFYKNLHDSLLKKLYQSLDHSCYKTQTFTNDYLDAVKNIKIYHNKNNKRLLENEFSSKNLTIIKIIKRKMVFINTRNY